MNDIVAKELADLLQVCPDEKGLVDPSIMHSRVATLQDELLKMPQSDVLTYHSFKPGVYERTIIVPPWTVLTGAEHRTDYKVRLDQGTIAVNIDDQVRVLTGPLEFTAKAGAQRAGRVFNDLVVWTDIYDNPDDCRDIDVLEQRYYKVTPGQLTDDLITQRRMAAQADYRLFLSQVGATQAQMDAMVCIDSDLMPMPEGFAVEVKPSDIAGNGMFALTEFKVGELVCPGRLDGKRTPAGRFVNHSIYANVEPVKAGDDINFIALRNITAGEEILVDYRASMRVNFGAALQGEMSCQE